MEEISWHGKTNPEHDPLYMEAKNADLKVEKNGIDFARDETAQGRSGWMERVWMST